MNLALVSSVKVVKGGGDPGGTRASKIFSTVLKNTQLLMSDASPYVVF